ncbi:MAG TPA: peptide-N-glycosidase F-related protein [Bacteroidia bacterium]|nr:peptide-N-glycosidase F-related protein [Bacteroidia bacterium]
MNQIKYAKRIFFLCFLVVFGIGSGQRLFAAQGDTIVVHGFNNFLHQNCNSGTSDFLFPPDSVSAYKIMLKYQLSCPGMGCDIYDRIATLKVKRHTGEYDSTLTLAPNFTVNGSPADSVWFMRDTSYQYSYDTVNASIDSFPFPSVQLLFFNDSLNPFLATDTLIVWPAYYNEYLFDTNGIALDSAAVPPDSMVYYLPDSIYSAPFEVLESIEIARAITPFGQGVTLWFDVSDYKPILKDSVTLYTNICGYSNGWLVTTDFYFIGGLPPAHSFKIKNLWNGTFPYGNAGNPIENHLPPMTLDVDTQTVYAKTRLVTTGHGFGGFPNQNVAEFYDVTHQFIAGQDTLPQHLWRADCGLNPLYPQGAPGYSSTWFYNRANWCPGSTVTPHDYNISGQAVPGSTLTLDYNMVPYTVTGGPSGWYPPEYYIQSHVIYYDQLNYLNNAALLEVRRPNGAFEYNRNNPSCDGSSPEIVIRNYGSAALTTLNIHYGVDGSALNTFVWTGQLEFLDTAQVLLPPVNFGPGNHTFIVYLDNPNLSADEFGFDDTLTTSFIATDVLNVNGLWIQLKNDGSPNEASWDIKDESGTVIFSRSGFSTAYALYEDTVYLSNGCYSVSVYDSYGDGLCCYGGGQGFFSINSPDGNVLYMVRDFGAAYSKNLTIDYTVGTGTQPALLNFFIYPNPAHDLVRINTSIENGRCSLEILDLSGRIVYANDQQIIESHMSVLNLSGYTSGIYFIRLTSSEKVLTKKLIIN